MYYAAGITSFASSVFLKMVGEEDTWKGTLFYGFGYICLHFILVGMCRLCILQNLQGDN